MPPNSVVNCCRQILSSILVVIFCRQLLSSLSSLFSWLHFARQNDVFGNEQQANVVVKKNCNYKLHLHFFVVNFCRHFVSSISVVSFCRQFLSSIVVVNFGRHVESSSFGSRAHHQGHGAFKMHRGPNSSCPESSSSGFGAHVT